MLSSSPSILNYSISIQTTNKQEPNQLGMWRMGIEDIYPPRLLSSLSPSTISSYPSTPHNGRKYLTYRPYNIPYNNPRCMNVMKMFSLQSRRCLERGQVTTQDTDDIMKNVKRWIKKDHPTMTQIIIAIRITTTIPIPIRTFLFFHHILFFTLRAVFFMSRDWSLIVSLFFTKISIFSPLSITLSMFFSDISSSSVSYFFNSVSLSTREGSLYFVIMFWSTLLNYFNEWATAELRLPASYWLKNWSCTFFKKLTAILVSYWIKLQVPLSQPLLETQTRPSHKCKSNNSVWRTGQKFLTNCIFEAPTRSHLSYIQSDAGEVPCMSRITGNNSFMTSRH